MIKLDFNEREIEKEDIMVIPHTHGLLNVHTPTGVNKSIHSLNV